MKHIELNRRFRKLNPLEDPEEAALESYTASLLDPESDLGWEELLKWPIVVVLGEPGSGKTWELRERAKTLRARSQTAFFIPLDRLISERLTEILSPEQNSKFQVWLRNQKEALFFLDSVDEAKHRRTSDFCVALDRFRNAIGSNNISRLHLLISSRISEWRPQSDNYEVTSRFPQSPLIRSKKLESYTDDSCGRGEKQEGILVVQIEPLDRSRVERFARELDIVDTAAFVRALDEKHAWPFARRPIDVINLLNYWNEHQKLGSLKDLIEYDLNQKLKEPRERQDLLTPMRARQGAEMLGAAVVFCRNFNFRVPNDSCVEATTAIDASACLCADWLPIEKQMLLTRPLFDSASYGRIRFHHRRSAEYLAAKWLENRMKEGCPSLILEDLLFTRIRNKDVIRPSLAPVTAWLCAGKEWWQEDIRNRVLKAAPGIHLLYGDPSQLSLEYRRNLLKALVKRYEGRRRIWMVSEHESLSRLADPGLADDVTAIIRDRTVSTDLRCEMLRLVQHGRLTSCLEAALELIEDEAESSDIKVYAAIALRDTGGTSHLLRLWEIIKRSSLIPTRLCALCCEALYPNVIDAEGLADLLHKSEAVPSNAVDLPYYLRIHLEEVVKPAISGYLLVQLVGLLEEEPHIKKDNVETPLSARFYWLGQVVPSVLKVLLEKDCLTDDEIDATARAFWLLGVLHHGMIMHKPDLKTDLNAKTTRHPEVRRQLFWRLVEEWKRKKKNETELTYPIYLFSQIDSVKPTPSDLEWAINDIKTRKDESDRVIILRMIIGLWHIGGAKWGDRQRIRHTIANDAFLLKEFKRLAEQNPLVWVKRIWYRHIKFKLADGPWWRSLFYSARQRYWEFRWQWAYIRNIRLLKSGQATGWLSDLVREADESHSQWAPRTWNKLVEKRGRLIPWAVKEGCKAAWPQFVPLLPHEKPDPFQTDHRVIVGLAGLQAAISYNELEFKKLTDENARLAVRYAVNEMNGFPQWLPELAKKHPLAVQDILAECVRGEWRFDAKREHVHEVLSHLSYGGEVFLPMVRDSILVQIRSGDPPNISVLETALRILIKNVDASSAAILAEIAEDRITQYSPESPGFMLWLAVWLQLNAEPALRYLQQILSRNPDADNLMVRLCDALHGDSRQGVSSVLLQDYAEPIHLRTFVPLVYSHIRPSEDIRQDGCYSPTARDDALRFRNSLIERLSQSESAEADDVLHQFLQNPAFATHRDYILHLLDKRAERQADLQPWNPEDILVFTMDYETDPKTDRELFKIACRRLQEIKNDVERADRSIRFEMHREYDERKLRIWLASKLQKRSLNRYMVPQEEEIDRRKRPDLRLEKPGVGPVSIEVKWADKWTLPELLEGLENQLVGQYLRDDNSRYGIYLLGYIHRKNNWDGPDKSSSSSFDQVVAMIDSRAKAIVAECRNIQDIAVISMDFTDH